MRLERCQLPALGAATLLLRFSFQYNMLAIFFVRHVKSWWRERERERERERLRERERERGEPELGLLLWPEGIKSSSICVRNIAFEATSPLLHRGQLGSSSLSLSPCSINVRLQRVQDRYRAQLDREAPVEHLPCKATVGMFQKLS